MMHITIKHRPVWIGAAVALLLLTFYLGKLAGSGAECTQFNRALPLQQLVTHNRPITYLLMIIMSGPDDEVERDTVRDTWLRLSAYTDMDARHFFPIGTKGLNESQVARLEREQHQHQDLVFIEQLEESFDNLAHKTAHSLAAGVDKFQFEFVLKTDTDSFVQVGRLLKALRDIAHPRLYWGFLDGRAKPLRRGKYREKDWLLCDRYLPYQLGGGYVLAAALAQFVAANRAALRVYRAEDVSVGVWLAGVRVKYVHDPRFDTEYVSRGCHNDYLVTHKHDRHTMHAMARQVRERGRLCAREFQARPSYVYDFSAPPSLCCQRQNGSRIP